MSQRSAYSAASICMSRIVRLVLGNILESMRGAVQRVCAFLESLSLDLDVAMPLVSENAPLQVVPWSMMQSLLRARSAGRSCGSANVLLTCGRCKDMWTSFACTQTFLFIVCACSRPRIFCLRRNQRETRSQWSSPTCTDVVDTGDRMAVSVRCSALYSIRWFLLL